MILTHYRYLHIVYLRKKTYFQQLREETGMSKSEDVKKSEKKKPQKTAKEKKQAKQEKKKNR